LREAPHLIDWHRESQSERFRQHAPRAEENLCSDIGYVAAIKLALMAASEQGLLTDVTRVSTILIRGGYLIRQSTLGKTMSTDDKKTSPAPKNGGVEKKAVAAKKDEGQPKDKTAADADRSQAESGETVANSPSGCSRGEGQKPVSKAYRDNWNAIFGNKKKKRR
jgi:hypothetical protein